MKYFFTLIFASLLFIGQPFAQANFEGTVKFRIDYEELSPEMSSMEDMLPRTMTTKIKGNKSRTEQISEIGTTTVIYDDNKNNSISLINILGKKVAIEMSAKEIEKEKSKKGNDAPPEIQIQDPTKEIAGYLCNKAIIYPPETDETITVFYTNEIQAQKIGVQYEGLEGFPMEYQITSEGLTMNITATKVIPGKISNSEFIIPEGYEKMTAEEFQKSIETQTQQE